jgi:hypothetical protein
MMPTTSLISSDQVLTFTNDLTRIGAFSRFTLSAASVRFSAFVSRTASTKRRTAPHLAECPGESAHRSRHSSKLQIFDALSRVPDQARRKSCCVMIFDPVPLTPTSMMLWPPMVTTVSALRSTMATLPEKAAAVIPRPETSSRSCPQLLGSASNR